MSKDGGTAFPYAYSIERSDGISESHFSEGGMTLRDYFAARAINGLISNVNTNGETLVKLLPDMALVSYAVADAMLKARDQ